MKAAADAYCTEINADQKFLEILLRTFDYALENVKQ